jgi:H+/Cl- antiporter ClcA
MRFTLPIALFLGWLGGCVGISLQPWIGGFVHDSGKAILLSGIAGLAIGGLLGVLAVDIGLGLRRRGWRWL